MSPEPFNSLAKALPTKRSEKGYGDENESTRHLLCGCKRTLGWQQLFVCLQSHVIERILGIISQVA